MGSNRRRCEGIIVDRPSHLPYWKRCTAFAMHDLDYCVMCFQRRVQNDSARAALVPGWEKILVGDETRKGKGKLRLGLDPADKEAAAALRAKRQPPVVAASRPTAPTEPILLPQKQPPATPTAPVAPDAPDDIFSAARKALAQMSKI